MSYSDAVVSDREMIENLKRDQWSDRSMLEAIEALLGSLNRLYEHADRDLIVQKARDAQNALLEAEAWSIDFEIDGEPSYAAQAFTHRQQARAVLGEALGDYTVLLKRGQFSGTL